METKPESNTPFGAALSYFLGQKKWGGASAFARHVGISQGYISELAAGKKDGKEDKRRIIAEALGLQYEQFLELGERILAGEEGGAVLSDIRSRPVVTRQTLHLLRDAAPVARQALHLIRNKAEEGPPGPDFVAVKKAKVELSAGAGTFVYDDGVEDIYYFRLTWLTRLRGRSNTDGLVVFPVKGASMEPSFKDGGLVLVDLLDTELWDDKVYAIRIDDSVRLKRLKRSESVVNGVDVISDNTAIDEKTGKPVYEDKTVDGAELCIIGRVLWHSWEM